MDSMVPNSCQMNNISEFELLDFFDANNIDIENFANLIRGVNEEEPFSNLDDNLFGQLGPTKGLEGDLVGQMNGDDDLVDQLELEAYDDDDDESSEGNTASTNALNLEEKKSKVDRSKTLISERRRRGKMKEKLYALRALVPNITKMDKASIVGDAVRYVKELQMQAKKLKEEIGGLEASFLLSQDQTYKASNTINNINQIKFHRNNQFMMISKSVIQMDMFQVEERGFYLRLSCNKGYGIAASIYKVLESLTNVNIQTSNLASAMDTLELTVTLRVKEGVRDMNLPNLKLWVVGALLNEGFEFQSTFCL